MSAPPDGVAPTTWLVVDAVPAVVPAHGARCAQGCACTFERCRTPARPAERSMLSDGVVLRRADGVLAQELDGELLLLPLDAPQALHLNPSAADVWQALETPRSPEQVTQVLARHFETEVAVIRADVSTVIESLLAGGALRIIDRE